MNVVLEACSLFVYIDILARSSAFIVATIVLVDLVVRYYSGAIVLVF